MEARKAPVFPSPDNGAGCDRAGVAMTNRGATRTSQTTSEDAAWLETSLLSGRGRHCDNMPTCTAHDYDAQFETPPCVAQHW
jgi:hypothetical protein